MSSPVPSPVSRASVRSRAGAAVERARLTVVPRTRVVRAPRVPFVLLVSALMLAGVVGLLMFNTSMQQAAFTTTTLEERAANLQAREQQLLAELEDLRDPQRLAVAARTQGMRTPPAPAFLHPDGSVSGVPTPAKAEDGERIRPRGPVVPAVLDPAPRVVDAPARPAGSNGESPAAAAAPGR